MKNYGAIDIGSNAVRLLIKRLEDENTGSFSKSVLLRVPLRLGGDVFTTGLLSDKKSADLVDLMRAYAIVLKLYEVDKSNMRACATAALREAANGKEIAERILAETGINVEIITGREEAAIACSNVLPDDNRTVAYVDVGGGSTEVSLISRGHTLSSHSYRVGTVRIINGVVDPYWKNRIANDMHNLRLDYISRCTGKVCIIGAGGNINKLFSLAQDREVTHRTMSVETLRGIYEDLRSLDVKGRMELYRLKPDRADVIVPAAEVFLTIADALEVDQIEIPSDGLSDGIIQTLWNKFR
ncbi:MAG: Ppx/GppA family phosphatase [Bacteroidales bacterium]|nr:Ppx/GppA family phosphatase [Bacteroidales bacterium]